MEKKPESSGPNQDYTPIKVSTMFGIKSLAENLTERKTGRTFTTGCKILNEFLNGGIQTGILTEIYGEAGTGKTQLCVQIMLESLYDLMKKKLQGKCIYISTFKHLHEMKYDTLINAFLKRHKLHQGNDIRSHIINFHTLELKHFEKVIDSEIPKILASGEQINVLVIDTITSIAAETLENNDIKNLFERVFFLKEISTKLKRLAYQNDLAVIVVNNVAAGFSEDFKKANKVVPSLGAIWSSFINERLKLHKYPENIKKNQNNENTQNQTGPKTILRSLKVKLSSRLPKKELFYLIDNEGIKGLTTNI